jgi:L-fucose mutarotase
MLKGISPRLSPELLKALYEMGHGEDLLLADAHFPGHILGSRVLRADGLTVTQMLEAVLPLLDLDMSSSPLTMMQPSGTDCLDPSVEDDYLRAVRRYVPDAPKPLRIARPEFYDRARFSAVILITSELRPYGNIFLTKGITSLESPR